MNSNPANPAPAATPAQMQSHFELSITLSLHFWSALRTAVANSWGGPLSSDKRDWFCGAVIDLFLTQPDIEVEDVEAMLLQVMLDEFDANIDDGSAEAVAKLIMRQRTLCGRGEFEEVRSMKERWERMGAAKGEAVVVREEDQDTDGSDEEDGGEEGWNGLGDVEMGEAPQLVEVREKPAPEIDEDGFTKVVGKKRR